MPLDVDPRFSFWSRARKMEKASSESAYTMGARPVTAPGLGVRPKASGPGPGSYSVDFATKHRASAYSMTGPPTRTTVVPKASGPGPGSYSPAAQPSKHAASSFSFGGRSNSARKPSGEATPGPGAYDAVTLGRTKSSMAAYSMGKPRNARSESRLRSTAATPGPGAYRPSNNTTSFASASYSMGSRPASARPTIDGGVPAPSAYSPACATTQYASPSFSMGKPSHPKQRTDASPGPGQYRPEQSSSVRPPAWRIHGKSARTSIGAVGEATPGPGQYFEAESGNREITRFGNKMISSASAEWARTSARPSTARRFD
jgi:hypothetical protein